MKPYRLRSCASALPILSLCIVAGAGPAAHADGLISYARAAAETEIAEPTRRFGEARHTSVMLGAGVAIGGARTRASYTGFVSLERFLADEIQGMIELGGWFFDKDEKDAVGGTLNLGLRWHFILEEEWSAFASLGVGLLGASEEIPSGGSEFNFSPRAGLGMTWRLNDDDWRLIAGAQWQHFSNGRLFGGGDNLSFDALMLYAGVSIPF